MIMGLRKRWQSLRMSIGPALDEWKFIGNRIRRTPLSLIGLSIILFYVAIAVAAPLLAPPLPGRDPIMMLRSGDRVRVPDYYFYPRPPNAAFPFGTTEQQYDLFYGCVWGTQTAFRIAVLVVAISLVVGVVIGTVSGYYGGIIDELMMRFTDVILAFPGLLLTIALVISIPTRVTLLQVGSWAWNIDLSTLDKLVFSLILVNWTSYTRVIRSEILRIRTEDYVEAAKASGCSDFRILTRHVMPNAIFPIIVMASLDIGAVVLSAAALGFLGLGAPRGYSDWGQLVALSRNWIFGQPGNPLGYWHVYIIPGVFIFIFVLGWNLLGDAFRDVLDPMIRRR